MIVKMIKEKREEKKRHERAVAQIVADCKRMDAKHYAYEEMEKRKRKIEKRSEITERLFGIFKRIVYIPCIQIFNIASFICKVGLIISAITFYYGGYLLYKYFAVTKEINIRTMVVALLAPFIISFVIFVMDNLSIAMEESL